MSKIIKNLCVAYESAPRVIGSNAKILRPRKSEDVNDILKNNALESADISLKHALRKAFSVAEQSRVESEIAYAAAHKVGREQGYRKGLEKGRIDGAAQSEEKLAAAENEFLAESEILDKNYMLKVDSVKDECFEFAFLLAENVLGGSINRENPEFNDIKNTYLSAQPKAVKLEADGRVLEFETLKPQWIIEIAEKISGITAGLEQKKAEAEEKNVISINNVSDKRQTEETAGDNLNIAAKEAAACRAEENSEKLPGGKETFEKQENEIPGKIIEQPIEFPNLGASDSGIDDNYEVPDDKLVYIKPSIKKAIVNPAENLKFEDLKDLKKETLKAILRKAEVEDMAALSGVPNSVSAALLDACPRKTKEKALDAVKYLGPVPQNEIERAKSKIVGLAASYLEREE